MKELWDTCVRDLEILRKRVPESSTEDCEKAIKKIREIYATHDARNCFGIAANQLGMNVRAALLTVPAHYFDKPQRHSRVTIEFHNPSIVEWKGKAINQEWCYSLDKEASYIVQRYKEITIKDDKNGMTQLSGVAAYAAQHEIDHLNGKMICDKGMPSQKFMQNVAAKEEQSANSPCRCGSGKKHKRCCAKKQAPKPPAK